MPVTIAVDLNGRTEQVRVGTATRSGDGWKLRLFEMSIGGVSVGSSPAAAPRARASTGGAVFPNYGRKKGEPIDGAEASDLEYYAAGCRRTLADPAKARFHEKERVLLAAIENELSRSRGLPPMGPSDDAGGGSSRRDEPPPPSDDDDIPF